MHRFNLAEREISRRAWEIQVEGELDLSVAPRLQAAISGCAAPVVVIDLGRCEFLDSTGIAVIVQAQRERADDGRRLVVHSPGAQVLRILTITGLVENGLVFSDRDRALAATGADGSVDRTQ